MEFDEMKKIWDAQNSRPLYTLDEKALHNRIQSKMNCTLRLTGMREWLLILINLGAGGILIGFNRFKPGTNIFLYLEAAWMFATVVYFIVYRIRRIKASRRFDRSIRGDLDHSISLVTYQIRTSEFIRWNLPPMGAIMIFSGWEGGQLLKVSTLILASYTLSFYVVSKGIHADKKRKRSLQALKEKLETGM